MIPLSVKGSMMSSATSIDQKVRLKADATDGADAGFRPWHFFILAALAASTIAVLLSRQSTPEHLILISLTIAAAGAAAAGFYRTLAPLALEDVSVLDERPSERARALLEREKALVLRSIKELEFDKAMGKVSPKDFDEMAGRLRSRAVMLMKQLDEGASAYRELIERELKARMKTPATGGPGSSDPGMMAGSKDPTLPSAPTGACACGTANDPDAAFCKRCGARLELVH
jgi:hypothetical protein